MQVVFLRPKWAAAGESSDTYASCIFFRLHSMCFCGYWKCKLRFFFPARPKGTAETNKQTNKQTKNILIVPTCRKSNSITTWYYYRIPHPWDGDAELSWLAGCSGIPTSEPEPMHEHMSPRRSREKAAFLGSSPLDIPPCSVCFAFVRSTPPCPAHN